MRDIMPVKTVMKTKVKTLDEALIFMTEKMAESEAKTAESQAKTDLAIQKMTMQVEEMSKEVKDFVNSSKNDFSRINNRLGHLIEFIVAPGIRMDMEEFGHKFKYAKANKVFKGIKDGKKRDLAEVDLLLSNGTEVMAVEIKTTLSMGWVKEHIEKLDTLREFEKYTKIQGKKLLGAVAGVFINDEAREYAKKRGLYVIEILEDKKRLKIDKPSKCHVW
jgi:hypothetical protein